MDHVVVGCVQVRMRLPQRVEEIEESFERFTRTALTKRVRLMVFPQWVGLMAVAPALKGARSGLLKQADRGRRAYASLWTRTQGRLAGGVAGMLRADFGKALESALTHDPELVRRSYADVFGKLARQNGITVVAGSAYAADSDGVVRHVSMVFGPEGEFLGQQSAVAPTRDELALAAPGQSWQVIPTPAGRLGILIGNDMLYPEAGRLLAYAGAEVLIGLGASTQPVQYQRQRQGLLARVEENQLYGVMSFTVGYNPFTPGDSAPYVGRSLVAAPIAMTPRFNGVLVEMGSDAAEGLITAEWDFPALRQLWESDEANLRAAVPVKSVGRFLGAIYARSLSIDEATRLAAPAAPRALPEPDEPVDSAEQALTVDRPQAIPEPVTSVTEVEPLGENADDSRPSAATA